MKIFMLGVYSISETTECSFYIQRKHYKQSFNGDMHKFNVFVFKCAKYSGIIIKFTNMFIC